MCQVNNNDDHIYSVYNPCRKPIVKGKVLKIGIIGRVFAMIKEVWNRGMYARHKLFASWASCTLKAPL